MIGVLAQETARFSQFAVDLTRVDKPDGSTVVWRIGWDLAESHNALIDRMLADPANEWIWFMGDDHAFSPDILTRLLDHSLDIVLPVCLMRNPPYRPVNWVTACAKCGNPEVRHGPGNGFPTDDAFVPDPEKKLRLDLCDYPNGGLVEIEASGSAGLLVRRRVFETFPAPWFETGTGITNRVGEDVNFCRKARAAGNRIWCDLDTVLGHCCTAVVWPVREHDGWTYGFSMMGGYQITLPPRVGWDLADAHA